LVVVELGQLLPPQKVLTALTRFFLPSLQQVAVVVARTTPILLLTTVLMVVLAAARQVFTKPQQLVVLETPHQLAHLKVSLAVVLPPPQTREVEEQVLAAVVLRKLETLKTQTLAVLVVTVLLLQLLAHQ
jgi:hypothetical protein